MTDLSTLIDKYTQPVKEGQFVNGTLALKTNPNGQDPGVGFVEIPGCSDGMVPIEELRDVEIGDHIFALVIDPEGEEGCPLLSVRRAQREARWRQVIEARDGGDVVEARVLRTVKGGLIVEVFSQHAFLPASQIDTHRVENLEEWIGQTIEALIIEAERGRRSIVVSRRKLIETEQARRGAEQLGALEEGAIYEAKVTAIAPFGAFCSLSDDLVGLVHSSEMRWGRWNSQQPGVEVGETVQVKLIGSEIKNNKPRVKLSIRLTKPRPKRRNHNKKRGGKR